MKAVMIRPISLFFIVITIYLTLRPQQTKTSGRIGGKA